MAAKKKTKPANPPIEEVVETISTTSPDPVEPVYGVIFDCERLNIRKEPNPGANIVCVVDAKVKLSIDLANSTEDWYKVYTETGLEGYCMKKYVKIV